MQLNKRSIVILMGFKIPSKRLYNNYPCQQEPRVNHVSGRICVSPLREGILGNHTLRKLPPFHPHPKSLPSTPEADLRQGRGGFYALGCDWFSMNNEVNNQPLHQLTDSLWNRIDWITTSSYTLFALVWILLVSTSMKLL